MVKKLAKLMIGIVIVLVIVAAVAWMMIDSIAAGAIEKGGTYALGVPVTVDNVDIGLIGGSVGLDGLTVANPEGFTEPHLMAAGHFGLKIEGGSVLSDTVRVPLIELNGLDVYYIKTGDGDNVQPILDNLERFKSDAPAEDEPAAEAKPGRKFIVDRLTMTDITLHLRVPVVGTRTVKINRIEMDGLTQDNAQGMAMSELMGRIVPAVLASVFSVDQVAELVPNVAGSLVKQLGHVDALATQVGGKAGQMAEAVIGQGTEALKDAGQKGTEALKKVTGEGSEALKKAAEGAGGAGEDLGKKVEQGISGALEGVFGGKKDQDDAGE